MTEVRLNDTTPADLVELAPRLQPADLAEVLAVGFPTALAGLKASLENSEYSFTARFDGELAVVWGLAPYEVDGGLGAMRKGIVWALTTDAVRRHPMTFFRHGKPAVELLLEVCGELVQWVDARHAAALRWVRHLGFKVAPPAPYKASGQPFCFVSLRRA